MRRCCSTAKKSATASDPHVDVAVDPIDGTTLTAHGKTNALSVIAVADRGAMLDPGPSYYMEKIAVGPDSVGSIDITASPTQNLRWIAKSKREDVRDLTAVILDRPRHADLIGEVRASRLPNPADHRRRRLRVGGDLRGPMPASTSCSASAARRKGSSPPRRCKAMGGEMQARFAPQSDEERTKP